MWYANISVYLRNYFSQHYFSKWLLSTIIPNQWFCFLNLAVYFSHIWCANIQDKIVDKQINIHTLQYKLRVVVLFVVIYTLFLFRIFGIQSKVSVLSQSNFFKCSAFAPLEMSYLFFRVRLYNKLLLCRFVDIGFIRKLIPPFQKHLFPNNVSNNQDTCRYVINHYHQ